MMERTLEEKFIELIQEIARLRRDLWEHQQMINPKRRRKGKPIVTIDSKFVDGRGALQLLQQWDPASGKKPNTRILRRLQEEQILVPLNILGKKRYLKDDVEDALMRILWGGATI